MRASSFVLFSGVLASVVHAAQAGACGGCFHETVVQASAADTVVTGHRMAFAISAERTVLWDQIKYTGSPKEFGWVLPVRPGAYIEASTDAWFEALDAATNVQVSSPPVTCPPPTGGFGGSSKGCGCGFSSEDSGTLAANAGGTDLAPQPPPVTVVHQGTVGPFETVTLSSSDGSALRDWLTSHGYAVPPEIEPVIDTYVSEGADFIALRLLPGKGVNAMKPVRVVTPGGSPILPLRMVAAGTGSFVDIVLYVIGEGRYGLKDLTESPVDLSTLTFDFAKNDSNYAKLRNDALTKNNGYSYLTAFATLRPFSSQFDNGPNTRTLTDTKSNTYSNLTSLYFGQATLNDGKVRASFGFDSCLSAMLNRADSDLLVGPRPLADGGAPSKARDGGSPGDAAGFPALIPADLTCDGYDDIGAALIGMHPDRAWLARLEMNLPHEALSMDCNVELSASQETVASELTAPKVANACPGGVLGASVADSFASSTSMCVGAVASLFALVGARRRKRRA